MTRSVRQGPGRRRPEQVHAYREALEDIDRRLTEEGIPHRSRDYVRRQTPAEDLSQAVEEEGADLLGSDAQDILLSTPCPVVGVKASPV